MTPPEAIEVYNRVVEARGLSRPKQHSINAVRAFLAWCEEHEIDPELWIRARHDSIAFRHRISFKRLVSPKFLPKFRSWGEQAQAHGRWEETAEAVPQRDFSTPPPLYEAMKRALRDNRDLCMIDIAMTGGYRWDSDECQRCEVQKQCREMHDRG